MCTITKTLAKQASEQHRKCEKGPFLESLSDDQPLTCPLIFRVISGYWSICAWCANFPKRDVNKYVLQIWHQGQTEEWVQVLTHMNRHQRTALDADLCFLLYFEAGSLIVYHCVCQVSSSMSFQELWIYFPSFHWSNRITGVSGLTCALQSRM